MSEGTPKHYQLKIEPVVYIVENEMNFLDGNMIKYASRHRQKDGAKDVLKAIHYGIITLKEVYKKTDIEIRDAINELI